MKYMKGAEKNYIGMTNEELEKLRKEMFAKRIDQFLKSVKKGKQQ